MSLIIKNWLSRNRNSFSFIGKQTSVFALVCFFNYTCFAQGNLVPNGSFESLTSAPPSGYGELNYAAPWFQPHFGATTPGGSTDLYSPACGNPDCKTPNNYLNYQIPKTGSNYMGFGIFSSTADSNSYREYAEVKLIDTLKPNMDYCLNFYVSFANAFNSSYACNKLGCYFSADSVLDFSSGWSSINVSPQIVESSILNDTVNWVAVSGVYHAIGGESFITLGNFDKFYDITLDTVPNGATGTIYAAYYFVDDVSVYEQPKVFAGVDTLIPPGDSIQLGVIGRPDISYSWSPTTGLSNPNISNPMATPGASTFYILTVTDTNQLACTNVYKDTVLIQVGYAGVTENNFETSFNIYPNPVNKDLYIESTKLNSEFVISDLLGKQIERIKIRNTKAEVDLSELKNGVYFIRETNRTAAKKIIILH
ncbi:MAG: T9SS type A sorting domain-containing protein [Bacteroidia bacterium]